ncbi:hypothetical protein GGF31_002617 [Allomyces arbusculus]|nr:hypothetical protein GGF31_002617 [Allomyces arbusculus]
MLPREQRLPRSLRDTYRESKANTSWLAAWLITAAETLKPAPAPAAAATKPKFKIKRAALVLRHAKRKTGKTAAPVDPPAQAAAASALDSTTAARETRVIVKAIDFVTLAQKVADARVTLPAKVISRH